MTTSPATTARSGTPVAGRNDGSASRASATVMPTAATATSAWPTSPSPAIPHPKLAWSSWRRSATSCTSLFEYQCRAIHPNEAPIVNVHPSTSGQSIRRRSSHGSATTATAPSGSVAS